MDAEKMYRRLAYKVNVCRTALHMSVYAYAKWLGVSNFTVARIENGQGNPTIYTLGLICERLGMSPNELLGWDEASKSFGAKGG